MYKIKSPEQGILKTGVGGIVCCTEKLNFCIHSNTGYEKDYLPHSNHSCCHAAAYCTMLDKDFCRQNNVYNHKSIKKIA
jgi:hypothetical protein